MKITQKIGNDDTHAITMYLPIILKKMGLNSISSFVRNCIMKYLKQLAKLNITNFNEMKVVAIYKEPQMVELFNNLRTKIPHVSFSEVGRVAIMFELMQQKSNENVYKKHGLEVFFPRDEYDDRQIINLTGRICELLNVDHFGLINDALEELFEKYYNIHKNEVKKIK